MNRWVLILSFNWFATLGLCQTENGAIEKAMKLFHDFQYEQATYAANLIISDSSTLSYDKSRAHRLLYDIHKFTDKENAREHLLKSISIIDSELLPEHTYELILNTQDYILHIYPDSVETTVHSRLHSLFDLYSSNYYDSLGIQNISDFLFNLINMFNYCGTTPEIEKLIARFTKSNSKLSSDQKGQILFDLAEYYRFKNTVNSERYFLKAKDYWSETKDDRYKNALARINLSLLNIDREKNKRGYSFEDIKLLDDGLIHLMDIKFPMTGDSFLVLEILQEKFMIYSDFENPEQFIDSVIINLETLIKYYPSTYKDFNYYRDKTEYTKALMATYLLKEDLESVRKHAKKGIKLCEEIDNSSIFLTDADRIDFASKKALFNSHVDEIKGLSMMDDIDDEISIKEKILLLQNRIQTELKLGHNQDVLDTYKEIISLLESVEIKTIIDSIGLFSASKGAFTIAPSEQKILYGIQALKYFPKSESIVQEKVIEGKCQLLLRMANDYLKVYSDQDRFLELIGEVIQISKKQGFLNFECDAYLSLAFHYNSIGYFEKQHEYLNRVEVIFQKDVDIKYHFFDDYQMCHSLYFVVTGNKDSLYPFTRNIKEFYDSAGYKDKSHELMTLLSIGSLYANFVNLDTAIYYLEECEKKLNSRLNNYDTYKYYTLAGKGLAYDNFGEITKAKIYYERALDFLYSKNNVVIEPDNQYNVLVRLYSLNVRFFSATQEEFGELEEKIERLSSIIDVTRTISLLNNSLQYYTFWSERNRSLDYDNTLAKMEEIISWVENDLIPGTHSWKNTTSYQIAGIINAYLNIKSYSRDINYDLIKERFKWVDNFMKEKLSDPDKLNESRKLFHYFMGLIASLDHRGEASLDHLQQAMDIPSENMGYQNELTYLYYKKLFDNALRNGNDQQALDAINGVEQLIENAQRSDPGYHSNLQNKIIVLSRFYIIKNIEPPPFFYDKIIESFDRRAYINHVDDQKIKAISYLHQNPDVSRGSADSKYFLNFNVDEHIKDPAEVPIQNLLPEKGAFIFIFKTIRNSPDHYVGVIMKKSGKNMLLDLGPDTILETLKDQKKHLNNYNQLYKTYWEKLDVQLEGIESLVLVMNGVYQKINPMVLQDNEGIFLVDKYEIDILFSVLDLYFDGFEVNIDTRNITLIGNPSFTIDSTLIVNTENKEFIDLNRGGSGNKSWITLPGTGSEVNDIKEAFYNYEYNVDLVTGNDATEAYVRSVSNPEILHLATHGFVNPKKNKYSNGLVFSGANDTQEWDPKDKDDGYLMAEDILQMNLVGTKLVALSACETGLFNTEALDFRNAFVMAGAKHILVSLWKIDDKATRDLMTRFYSSLAQTNRIRMSFQDTQNYMKEKYKNPYYWGSFILISTSLDTQLN